MEPDEAHRGHISDPLEEISGGAPQIEHIYDRLEEFLFVGGCPQRIHIFEPLAEFSDGAPEREHIPERQGWPKKFLPQMTTSLWWFS